METATTTAMIIMEMEEVTTITTMIGIQNGDTIHCLQGNRGK